MNSAIVTVVGKDRVGIVAHVATLLAEANVNIANITQQVLDGYFTMIILADLSDCTLDFGELASLLEREGKSVALEIRIQNEEIFEAMHRIG